MNEQLVFDKVATHLLTQMAKSENEATDECRYRDDDGRKCAIGALIPDELYSSRIEGLVASDLLKGIIPAFDSARFKALYEIDRWPSEGMILNELQEVHDAHPPARWRDALLGLAKKYKLSTAVLDPL